MLIAYMPRVIRNPLKHIISKLDVPFSGQVLTGSCGERVPPVPP